MSSGEAFVILTFVFSMGGFVVATLIASVILQLFSKFFKFSKTDFKTAISCNLIIAVIFGTTSCALFWLFSDQLQKLSSLLFLLTSLISLIIGTFVVRKFYGSSILKSFFALFIAEVIWYFTFTFVIIILIVIMTLNKTLLF